MGVLNLPQNVLVVCSHFLETSFVPLVRAQIDITLVKYISKNPFICEVCFRNHLNNEIETSYEMVLNIHFRLGYTHTHHDLCVYTLNRLWKFFSNEWFFFCLPCSIVFYIEKWHRNLFTAFSKQDFWQHFSRLELKSVRDLWDRLS